MLTGLALGRVPLAWIWWRHPNASAAQHLAGADVELFITFDLVLFGAFTRLTDLAGLLTGPAAGGSK
jgi:hypothetical protein